MKDKYHYLITLYIVFGGAISFLLNNKTGIAIHVFINAIIILQWLVFGKCLVSKYDSKDEPSGYTRKILRNFGLNDSMKNTQITVYAMTTIPMLFSIYLFYKKQ